MRDDTRPPRDSKDPSPVRALRLVHPSPPRSTSHKSTGRKPPLFKPDEEARLRAALRDARRLFGTWACLADALHFRKGQIMAAAAGREPISGSIAVRLARALGKPLESLYRAPADASRCPTCGTLRGSP